MILTEHHVPNAKGVAVIQHGYPSNADCGPVQVLRKAFNALGITAITVDTTHNDNQSDGDYLDMILGGHINDLEDCIKHITSKHKDTPLILAGHSAGAHSAIVVSQRMSDTGHTPAMTVAVAPLISGQHYLSAWQDMMQERNPDIDFLERWKKRGSIPYPSDTAPEKKLKLKMSVMEDWLKHDLHRDKIFLSSPLSIIASNGDKLTPLTTTYNYYRNSTNSEMTINVINGADHSFSEHEQPLAAELKTAITRTFGL